jgi:phage repressor protein C with HTH and peptisase S24 domain
LKNVQSRLKEAVDYIKREGGGITNEDVSILLDYKAKNYVSDVLGSGNVSDLFLARLEKRAGISPDWIKTGKGKMVVGLPTAEVPYQEKRRSLKNSAETNRRIPLYDAPAAGGITETDMTAIHAPAGTIDVGDLLHDSQAAIRIYGNSMLPGYPPGCVVGLNKVTADFIEPGEVYVIETRDRRILKRLFYMDDDPISDAVLCVSDNSMLFEGGARHGKLAYPPFLIPKKEIIQLFVVTGVIKRNTNSVIINRKA